MGSLFKYKKMKKFLREPFLHFIVFGVLLFVLYGFVNQESNNRDEIIIDTNDIESYTAKWEMQWKRPPTQEELSNLILQNIKQEVFYQEALKMNLDHNDEIIKRRLSQKMEFLSNDLATLAEPNDKELEDYYKRHSDKYLTPYLYSLYQIVFTSDNHTNPDDIIKSIIDESENLSFDDMNAKGDNLPFPFQYKNITSFELNSQLGNVFTDNLETIELNKWVGPVTSGFGKHLVYITEKQEPYLPALADVRDAVLRDYQYDKQKEVNQVIFNSLKNNYTIKFNFEDSEAANSFKDKLENKLSN